MKIAYFTAGFPYINPITGETTNSHYYGGVANAVYNLAVGMAKRGHEVSVFTTSANSKTSIEIYENITIYRYKKNFVVGNSNISINLLYKPLFSKVNIDIVHSHLGNLPAPLAGYFYAKIRKKPFIVTYHAALIGNFGGVARRAGVFVSKRVFKNKILSNANRIISVSKTLIDDDDFFRRYKGDINIIPNGINIKQFNIPLTKEKCRNLLNLPANKKIIIFVGGLTPIKAPHILLKAMKKVITNYPNSYLVFIGEGICRNQLKKLSYELGIDSNVLLVGFVSDIKVKAMYYNAADIFVLPSISESFGIVLLEASSSKLPLIVSDLKSLEAIVEDNYNGLFAEKMNSDDFANKIIYLLENHHLRCEMGKNALIKAATFSWDSIITEIEKVYFEFV